MYKVLTTASIDSNAGVGAGVRPPQYPDNLCLLQDARCDE